MRRFAIVTVGLAALSISTAALGQTVSPAGHYFKSRDGQGKMFIRQLGSEWRVGIEAGGVPNGEATAADCTILAGGKLTSNIFRGKIINSDDDGAHSVVVTFVGNRASVDADTSADCGRGDGVSGVYTKR